MQSDKKTALLETGLSDIIRNQLHFHRTGFQELFMPA